MVLAGFGVLVWLCDLFVGFVVLVVLGVGGGLRG